MSIKGIKTAGHHKVCANTLNIIPHSIKRQNFHRFPQISHDENMYAQSGKYIEIDGEATREKWIWEINLYIFAFFL